MAKNGQLLRSLPTPRDALVVPALALRTVTAKDGSGVYASSDRLFKDAVFGRDSLEVAEDLMQQKPRLVKSILCTLAALQGMQYDPITEEEPGKIVHEYRQTVIEGRSIDAESKRIFDDLALKWGGTSTELAYYGSIDATPHFLRCLGRFCVEYGNTILDEVIERRDGSSATVGEVAHLACGWLEYKLSNSRSGLIEYQRSNPHGIVNQVWKDSDEFYVHTDGSLANHDAPIASIEVQGLAYDALMAASRLFPEEKESRVKNAYRVRDTTLDLLWQEQPGYFALGLDYDEEGTMRIIKTPSANPAALLDTEFFDDLSITDRQKYVTAIAKKIMGPDFLTKAGIRSRSLAAGDLISFWDYHGSYVSWPKETYDIAKGLARQGLPKLARQLENRLINVVLKNRSYPEFVYVDEYGKVLNATPAVHTHGEIRLIDSTNNPERIQAWTVSAIYAIVSKRLSNKFRVRSKENQSVLSWQQELEQNIMSKIPQVNRYINPLSLLTHYPSHPYQLTK